MADEKLVEMLHAADAARAAAEAELVLANKRATAAEADALAQKAAVAELARSNNRPPWSERVASAAGNLFVPFAVVTVVAVMIALILSPPRAPYCEITTKEFVPLGANGYAADVGFANRCATITRTRIYRHKGGISDPVHLADFQTLDEALAAAPKLGCVIGPQGETK